MSSRLRTLLAYLATVVLFATAGYLFWVFIERKPQAAGAAVVPVAMAANAYLMWFYVIPALVSNGLKRATGLPAPGPAVATGRYRGQIGRARFHSPLTHHQRPRPGGTRA